jgi:hypothetical protein
MNQPLAKPNTLSDVLHFATIAEREKRFTEAESALKNAIARFPDDERAYLKLAWLKRNRGDLNEMKDILATVFNNNFEPRDLPLRGGAFDIFCENIFATQPEPTAIETVRQNCLRELSRVGDCSWARLYLGAVAFTTGHELDAHREFDSCVRLGDSRLGNTHGSHTYRDDLYIEHLGGSSLLADPLSGLTFHSNRSAAASDIDVIYALGCDGVYFDHFGPKMMSSLARKLDNAICHVHVVNPSDALLRQQNGFDDHIKITTSRFEFPPDTTYLNKKAFYTCLRFMLAPLLLKEYNKPVIVSEFDGQLSLPVASYSRLVGDADVGLSFYNRMNFFPWNNVWAGTVYFQHSLHGNRFANLVDSYCRSFFIGEKWLYNLWHVDQNALYCVYRFLSARTKDIRIINLKNNLPSLIHHDGGLYV